MERIVKLVNPADFDSYIGRSGRGSTTTARESLAFDAIARPFASATPGGRYSVVEVTVNSTKLDVAISAPPAS